MAITHDRTQGQDDSAGTSVTLNGAAGYARQFIFRTANALRWALSVNASAESGSDAGSNFEIASYTDAGAFKATIVSIARATGIVTLGGLLSTKASATTGAGLRLPHGAAPTSPQDGDMWTTTAGLYVHINGSTVGPLT